MSADESSSDGSLASAADGGDDLHSVPTVGGGGGGGGRGSKSASRHTAEAARLIQLGRHADEIAALQMAQLE
jgi:hypothetical protein